MSFIPPQADIDAALEVERSLREEDRALYLDCLDGVPFGTRVESPRPLDREGRDVRDGCILTGMFLRARQALKGY